MSNIWKEYIINQVCSEIVDCVNKTAATISTPTEYKMIRTTNVKSGWIDVENVRYVTKDVFDKWTRRIRPQKEDIILTREAPLGEVGLVRTDDKIFLGQRTILYRANAKIADAKFLYYSFLSEIVQGQFKSFGSGSTVEHIRIKDCETFKVYLPKIEIQQRIASILSAYDDLIDVNNQRIKLLEETAQQLYKEWFVRMRFPNYKKTKFEKGIPKGWNTDKVSNLLNRHKFGKTYKIDELENSGKVVVIDQSTDELLGYHNNEPDHIASSISPMIIFGDHTCKMQLMVEAFSLAENVIPISSKGNTPIYFLYYLINSLVETTEYKRHWNELVSKTVLVPEESLQKKYAALVQPFFEQINNLNKQNIELRQIRDRLLPRLISGKLQIKEQKELKKTQLVK